MGKKRTWLPPISSPKYVREGVNNSPNEVHDCEYERDSGEEQPCAQDCHHELVYVLNEVKVNPLGNAELVPIFVIELQSVSPRAYIWESKRVRRVRQVLINVGFDELLHELLVE